MDQFDAIIIGAGPAGMMAAIRAAERDRKILLLERNKSPGKKLLISGKGRCNLTNSGDVKGFLAEFSESRNFLRNAFARFFNADLISFFEDAGLKLKTERGGRVFPVSNHSSDVLDVLKSKLNNKNIRFLSGERVKKVLAPLEAKATNSLPAGRHGKCYSGEADASNGAGISNKVSGVLTYSGKSFSSGHIVIATGGLSYPQTGSTGDGYKLAEKLGHRIIPLKPALSAVCVKERFIRDWQGIALKNVRLTLFADPSDPDARTGGTGNKPIAERFGEMIFTHFGISGPIVLDLSAVVYDALALKNEVSMSINFKPALDYKTLDARLLREFKASPGKKMRNIFKNILPQGIIARFLEYCNVNADKGANQVTADERKRLIEGLFGLRLTVEEVMPVSQAIVTRGGVDTREINPKTMESKIVKGLFFAGEVIDIDARTGGYNMQAAFSTGWVCGDNI
ncbi:MAG: NAD(P)/FAD-dependent oxidoreductase [Planctomycetota bacterium]|nr:NAD(P)/FAD-dependent oxidoreductase [Planctomycetota bacterium]MDI6786990.1 NAD(P)/FAD-dependent oxidoreductase [Planctomycetota bacterium]